MEHVAGARDDRLHRLRVVEIQAIRRRRSGPARVPSQHRQAGGGADDGERRQLQSDRARAGPLADHDVEREVLHRRIEHFFDGASQAVDLVDEQHVAGCRLVRIAARSPAAFDGRTGGDLQVDAHLVRQDVRQRGLAQAGRAVEQDVVERLACGRLAARIRMPRFSLTRSWPMSCARRRGRSVTSSWSSGCSCLAITRFFGEGHAADYTGLPASFNCSHRRRAQLRSRAFHLSMTLRPVDGL